MNSVRNVSEGFPPVAKTGKGRVSVIVPTRNSARTLERCLASVAAQTYPDVELVVVDNHSTDESQQIAKRFAERVVVSGPERSAQRNRGAQVATGEFFLFVDGDMVLDESIAEEIAREFALRAGSPCLMVTLRSIGDNFWARCRALEKDLYVGDPDMEAARAFRRSAFESVGGFDERLHAGEDWDLSERVVAAGGSIGRISGGLTHDEGRVSLSELLAKKRYYGETLARYARKHPRSALRKFFRLALFKNSHILVRHPLLGAGLILMKILELIAAVIGAATASRHRTSAGGRRVG